MMLQAFSNPFGTAPLVNHLWQSTVVALAAWLLGRELVKCQRGLHSIGIAAESRIGAQELQTAHAPHILIGRLLEAFLQVRQRLLKLTQFRQRKAQQRIQSRQAWLQPLRRAHLVHRQLIFVLLKIDRGQRGVDFRNTGLQLGQLFKVRASSIKLAGRQCLLSLSSISF